MTDDDRAAEASDEVLWERALGGDEGAFASIFDRHIDRVHRQARRFVTTATDAEDVTAIVFLEAWRLRRRVRMVDGSVIAWLLVTTVNVARNMTRSRARHERTLRRLRVDDASDHAESVIEQVMLDGVRAPLRTAFESLSRSDQEVLALCVIEELRPREVAALMRLPAATIRTRLNRAKRRLRNAVEISSLNGWLEA